MFSVLQAYGIPSTMVNAIKTVYVENSAVVITPDGVTDEFSINSGVSSCLAVHHCPRQCLASSNPLHLVDDGFTLKRRRGSRQSGRP